MHFISPYLLVLVATVKFILCKNKVAILLLPGQRETSITRVGTVFVVSWVWGYCLVNTSHILEVSCVIPYVCFLHSFPSLLQRSLLREAVSWFDATF